LLRRGRGLAFGPAGRCRAQLPRGAAAGSTPRGRAPQPRAARAAGQHAARGLDLADRGAPDPAVPVRGRGAHEACAQGEVRVAEARLALNLRRAEKTTAKVAKAPKGSETFFRTVWRIWRFWRFRPRLEAQRPQWTTRVQPSYR